MSNVKKPNQHLENLIKADGFNDLPFWYVAFIDRLMMIGQLTHPLSVYEAVANLFGYIDALWFSDVIKYENLLSIRALVKEAEKFAIDNNVKKAA